MSSNASHINVEQVDDHYREQTVPTTMERLQEPDFGNVMDAIKEQDERQVTFATPDGDEPLRARKGSAHQNGVSSDEENTRRSMSERASSEIQASEMKKKSQSQRDLGLVYKPSAPYYARPLTDSP